MNLFVYEYITSGALIEETMPESLAEEGDAMLIALVEDLSHYEVLNINIMRDKRLKQATLPSTISISLVDSIDCYQEVWQQQLSENDFMITIAPETEQVLYQLQQEIEQHDIISLGCNSDAVLVCTDKLALSEKLLSANIETPRTYSAQHWLTSLPTFENGYIVKPIDGAGCLDTFLFNDSNSSQHYLNQQSSLESLIVQPYICGASISIAAYIDDNECCLLGINQQNIEKQDQQLHFIGCETVGAGSDAAFNAQQATLLLNQLQHTIAGLSGYIGIDLVISQSGKPSIIDINPRLTTGYLSIRQADSELLANKLFNTMSETEYV